MSNPRKYLDQLFISKVRIKAIRYFFMTPEQPIHLRAAVRELDEEINAVRRELTRMEEIKLLTTEKRGNRKYFLLNPNFLYYDELLGMVHKTFGLGGEIVTNASKLGEMQFALLSQGFVWGEYYGSHPIDLVVVGKGIDMSVLDSIVSKEEKKTHRNIHYTVLSITDFELHKRRKDQFVLELIAQNKVMLIGRSLDFMKSI